MTTALQARLPDGFPVNEVAAICERWGVSRLELFGSRARGDFEESSDFDFLYSKIDPLTFGLDNLCGLADDLEALLEKKVDLVSRTAVETSRNPYRKSSILGDAVVAYAK